MKDRSDQCTLVVPYIGSAAGRKRREKREGACSTSASTLPCPRRSGAASCRRSKRIASRLLSRPQTHVAGTARLPLHSRQRNSLGCTSSSGRRSAVFPLQVTRRGRPRKVFRYLDGVHDWLLRMKLEGDSEGNERACQNAVKSPLVKQTGKRRKKVSTACVFYRRSHMMCDEQRPCKRCSRRGIGLLCSNDSGNTAPNGSKTREKGFPDDEKVGSVAGSVVGPRDREQMAGKELDATHGKTLSGGIAGTIGLDCLSTMLMYLQEAAQERGSDQATAPNVAENTFSMALWTSFIQATLSREGPLQPGPSIGDAKEEAAATLTPTISVSQLRLCQPLLPKCGQTPLTPISLENLQRLLATMGPSPSPLQEKAGSPLLTPFGYAALRRASSPPSITDWQSIRCDTDIAKDTKGRFPQ